MAKEGLFNELDAALYGRSVTAAGYTTVNRKIKVSWRGKTAHPGSEPWNGRSALDADQLFTHSAQ